jgi:hypothetical protein
LPDDWRAIAGAGVRTIVIFDGKVTTHDETP